MVRRIVGWIYDTLLDPDADPGGAPFDTEHGIRYSKEIEDTGAILTWGIRADGKPVVSHVEWAEEAQWPG